jgi:hypothetical protein
MYTNARAMTTSYGGGLYGHLGLLMPYERYQAFAGVPYLLTKQEPIFVRPPPPDTPEPKTRPWWQFWTWRTEPQPIPEPDTSYKVYSDAQRKHDKAVEEWKAAHEFKRTMQQLILQAIPEMYLTPFRCSFFGYADIDPGEVLEHMIDTYGGISSEELTANWTRLQLPWDPDTPIETAFKNGETCRAFATDGDEPISDRHYIHAMVTTFQASGVLNQAVYSWKTLSEEERTVEKMKTHFTTADDIRRANPDTMRGALTANRAEPVAVTPSPKRKLLHYCWTHGFGDHAGPDCRYPATGHVNHATLENWEDHGGNCAFKRPRGYVQIFKEKENPHRSKRLKREQEAGKKKGNGKKQDE